MPKPGRDDAAPAWPVPAPAPPPPPDVDVTGIWKGSTSQGRDIEIEVDTNNVKVLRVGWTIEFENECVAPDGRHARFPAVGDLTGDWGGGYDVGLAAQSAASRSEDGRGPATSLERSVPAHFGLSSPAALPRRLAAGLLSCPRVAILYARSRWPTISTSR